MKILSAEQIRTLDKYTIEHEPVTSDALMERAATAFSNAVAQKIGASQTILVFCGMGNNGGDGLAVARMLLQKGFNQLTVYVVSYSPRGSADFYNNLDRVKNLTAINYIETENQLPVIPGDAVVIDAIFGTGLTRPVEGIPAMAITAINQSKATVFSIDVPSGLFCDSINNEADVVINSTVTYTFGAPKLSFLLAANEKHVPEFRVLDIGLDKTFVGQLEASYNYITGSTIQSFFRKRGKFSHKGTYGHALVCAGSYGKMGAAVLAVKAALRSGAGLVSACIASSGYEIMQISNPEAMVEVDSNEKYLTAPPDLTKFNAIGVGPGIGTRSESKGFLRELLKGYRNPLVIDADALNILSTDKGLLESLPENSILTPHPGEFKRLVGNWKDDLDKLRIQREFSQIYKVIVILKGANTLVSSPDGQIYFNSTGNPGMAKGGSGDVLTGMLTSILAQKYNSLETALAGVYIHGLSGDFAKEDLGETAVKSKDIIYYIPKAFKQLEAVV